MKRSLRMKNLLRILKLKPYLRVLRQGLLKRYLRSVQNTGRFSETHWKSSSGTVTCLLIRRETSQEYILLRGQIITTSTSSSQDTIINCSTSISTLPMNWLMCIIRSTTFSCETKQSPISRLKLALKQLQSSSLWKDKCRRRKPWPHSARMRRVERGMKRNLWRTSQLQCHKWSTSRFSWRKTVSRWLTLCYLQGTIMNRKDSWVERVKLSLMGNSITIVVCKWCLQWAKALPTSQALKRWWSQEMTFWLSMWGGWYLWWRLPKTFVWVSVPSHRTT